jgi:hypothetical protein
MNSSDREIAYGVIIAAIGILLILLAWWMASIGADFFPPPRYIAVAGLIALIGGAFILDGVRS